MADTGSHDRHPDRPEDAQDGGRHPAGRHGTVEDDREERDVVAASADGASAADAPDVGDDAVPGVRSG
ncbi:MAG: hypothetical protein OJJ54_11800 [Pseudonocardia sp.]|nr:hypothetical protein [Pseudonocardia sp.]